MTHADLSGLSGYPWGDMVVDGRGNAYIGNIGFDIAGDGTLTNRRVWADLPGAYPDGICLDADGAVWYADVPNQRCVRVREGGETLQTVELGLGGFACALGGPDRRTLFVTASALPPSETPQGQILTVPASVPGAGWP